jgi:hypothetical protein
MVELAVVLPLLVSLVLFSQFFVELVRAKLKVQEASRYLAWEMTSHLLSDYGGEGENRHALAFERAREQVVGEAQHRFQDRLKESIHR